MAAKINENELNFKMPSDLKFKLIGMMVIGIVSFVVAFITMGHTASRHDGGHSNPAWSALLVATFFIIGIALAGTFFTAISHITGSYWSVTVRRITESYGLFLPVTILLVGALAFGIHDLFEWSHPEVVAKDHLIKHKSAWLNSGFFVGRLVFFTLIWSLFGWLFYKNSVKQDSGKDLKHTHANVKLSAAYLIIFALTFCVASFDLLMSLTPHWFSTMFGIYSFAGMYQAGLSSFIVVIAVLKKSGYLGDTVNENHIHDIGKFMLSFCVFWAYIGFSQFMLIWYANIPEETFWYEQRMVGGWMPLTILLPIIKFIVPFLLLLNRPSKRDLGYLTKVAIYIVITQFIELYWIVFPSNFETFTFFGLLVSFGVTIGMAGLFGFIIFKVLEGAKLIPVGDPRLEQSLHHHQ
ncbi:MAG: hypothetical protein H7A25_11865 [Leptospiraceae bacterium]|nr:hypothetical protein [Leptospiraceae bacterium]MCP5500594.1 hypothetical protein [Leptospiraceae bacterium]